MVELLHFTNLKSFTNFVQNSTNLKRLVVPVSVTYFSFYSIRNNPKLEYIILLPNTMIAVSGRNALYNTNDCPVYVPDELVETYKADSNWSQYSTRFKPISEFSD